MAEPKQEKETRAKTQKVVSFDIDIKSRPNEKEVKQGAKLRDKSPDDIIIQGIEEEVERENRTEDDNQQSEENLANLQMKILEAQTNLFRLQTQYN